MGGCGYFWVVLGGFLWFPVFSSYDYSMGMAAAKVIIAVVTT